MAIIYPLAFPDDRGFIEADFTLGEVQSVNTKPNGEVLAMELGDRLWMAKMVTARCYARDRARWQAWRGALNGSIGTFLAFDPEKEYPLAYGAGVLSLDRAGGGAFDGTATLSAWTAGTVTLTGLPADYQAADGDMLSFAWNGGRALHMVVGDTEGSGAGVLTVDVVPFLRLSPAPLVDASVDLVRPSCIMRLRPNTFSASAARDARSVSFEAVQVP